MSSVTCTRLNRLYSVSVHDADRQLGTTKRMFYREPQLNSSHCSQYTCQSPSPRARLGVGDIVGGDQLDSEPLVSDELVELSEVDSLSDELLAMPGRP